MQYHHIYYKGITGLAVLDFAKYTVMHIRGLRSIHYFPTPRYIKTKVDYMVKCSYQKSPQLQAVE